MINRETMLRKIKDYYANMTDEQLAKRLESYGLEIKRGSEYIGKVFEEEESN